MKNQINQFRGATRYLSNFYDAPVVYQGQKFRNSEAAFQAAKVKDLNQRIPFLNLDPSRAKSLGRRVQLREDWEEIKDQVMFDVVLDKFTRNPDIREKLLATGDAFLTEGNDWNDMYWGMDLETGEGRNQLGKILMEVRTLLKPLQIMTPIPINEDAAIYSGEGDETVELRYTFKGEQYSIAASKIEYLIKFILGKAKIQTEDLHKWIKELKVD